MGQRVLGCILMIIGTAVGAGMLALPVATAHANVETTIAMMLFSWTVMTIGACAILEVNLWFPAGTNLISMADKTLGKIFKQLTWFFCLLLLYSLLCAYLSGTGDILQGLLAYLNIHLPRWSTTVVSLLLLALIVTRGVGAIDVANRGLMGVKLLAYAILVIAIAPHISLPHLSEGHYIYSTSTLMVVITSFGFANIIPTLRAYLHSDVKRLKHVIVGASLAALVIYLLWVFAVQGLLPREGTFGLYPIADSASPNSLLMKGISALLGNEFLGDISKLFISICALTSFLGVSICLVDFIADGLQYEKKGFEGVKVFVFTYLPPLVVVLFAPGIFIKALSYAGLCCVFLLILLPVLMLYRGRYQQSHVGPKIVPGGKALLIFVALIGIVLIALQLLPLI